MGKWVSVNLPIGSLPVAVLLRGNSKPWNFSGITTSAKQLFLRTPAEVVIEHRTRRAENSYLSKSIEPLIPIHGLSGFGTRRADCSGAQRSAA